jgi:hypothetical protein
MPLVVMGLYSLGCVAIGAYLALHGHPWFGFFALLCAGGTSEWKAVASGRAREAADSVPTVAAPQIKS